MRTTTTTRVRYVRAHRRRYSRDSNQRLCLECSRFSPADRACRALPYSNANVTNQVRARVAKRQTRPRAVRTGFRLIELSPCEIFGITTGPRGRRVRETAVFVRITHVDLYFRRASGGGVGGLLPGTV